MDTLRSLNFTNFKAYSNRVIFLLLFSLLLYLALLWYCAAGVRRCLLKAVQRSESPSRVSVIIPYRNEENNLAALLSDLKAQDFSGFSEFIWVNDHSEDAGPELLRAETIHDPRHHLLSLGSETGKKAALKAGIGKAAYPLILTTDADCRVPEGWLNEICTQYGNNEQAMLILPVKLTGGNGLLAHFQRAEHLALQAVTFGMAGMDTPVIANGANLAFSKTAFSEVGGYSAHAATASGDDVFLLHDFLARKKPVIPVLRREVMVSTTATLSWRAFLAQRVRWAAKSSRYRSPAALTAGAILQLASWMVVLSLVLAPGLWPFIVAGVCIRIAGDVLLIKKIGPLYENELNTLKLALFSAAYIFYLPAITVISLLWKPGWKGRRI